MSTQEVISTRPDVRGAASHSLIECVEECYACAQTCISCADAYLAEIDVEHLRQCIQLDHCADLCYAAGALASHRTGSNEEVLRLTLEACSTSCRICAEECERHLHEHCRICAEACRSCQRACESALPEVGGRVH